MVLLLLGEGVAIFRGFAKKGGAVKRKYICLLLNLHRRRVFVWRLFSRLRIRRHALTKQSMSMAWLSRGRGVSRLSRLVAARRSFGSSAAVAFEYDSDDEYMYGGDGRLEEARLELERERERGVQWVVMGAWRHVFAERLSSLLEVAHISMGSLVRQELSPTSSLYKQIASAVNEGKHVPKGLVFALLSKRLEEGYARGESGFILDGIPRTLLQAETLDQIAHIDLVVNLKCSEEHLVNRAALTETPLPRRHEFLGSILHSAVAIKARRESLSVYAEEVKPLEDYYRKQRKLLDFHVGAATSAETWQGLLSALHLKQTNLATSQKLTL